MDESHMVRDVLASIVSKPDRTNSASAWFIFRFMSTYDPTLSWAELLSGPRARSSMPLNTAAQIIYSAVQKAYTASIRVCASFLRPYLEQRSILSSPVA